MKVETRGKYPGAKLHLDPEECEALMQWGAGEWLQPTTNIMTIAVPLKLARTMGQKIKELLGENPDLLKERTPEQIAAILAKESEKAGIQLNRLKNGKDWKKVDPHELEKALMHHVNKQG